MAWAPLTSGSSTYNGGAVTSRTATCGHVEVGQTICVGVMHDNISASDAVVTDNLGNSYVRQAGVTDGTNLYRVEAWLCIVTVTGTPTVTVQFNPSPGVTTVTVCDLNVDPFVGSNPASTVDGVNAQLQAAPTTATDAISSGTFGTSFDGSLIYGATVNTVLGDGEFVGTAFTLATANTNLVTEWKQAGASGTEAAVFTGDNTRHVTAGFGVKAGSVVPDDADQTLVMMVQRWDAGVPCF